MPVTSFIKDGGIINQDHMIVKGSKLVITKARFADGGVYTCRAKSLSGYVTVSSHITIIGELTCCVTVSRYVTHYIMI